MLIDPSQVRVPGPLAAFAAGFADELARQGYRPLAARNQMWLLAHLSRWLVSEEFGANELRTTEVERFLRARRAAGYTFLLSIKAMQPILGYLRGLKVVPPPPPPTPSGPVEGTLERYRSYSTVERGLGNETARGYIDAVRPFLQRRLLPDGLALDLGHLAAADVVSFVVARCPHQSRGAASLTVTALRSLLGFLHVDGNPSDRWPLLCHRSPAGDWPGCPRGWITLTKSGGFWRRATAALEMAAATSRC